MPTTILADVRPTRHGKARLAAVINDHVYRLRKLRRDLWAVTNNSTGACYHTGRNADGWCCTCPDRLNRGAFCKHLGALVALNLVSRPRRKAVANG